MPTSGVAPTHSSIDAHHGELSAADRPGIQRHLLVLLAWFYAVVAVVGFSPSFRDHFAGEYVIHPLALAHGVLMAAWLALFIMQTHLAASGSMRLHRRMGLASLGLAALVWGSMIVASVRPLLAEAIPVDHFLYDVLAVQVMTFALFTTAFVAGFLARRQPGVHKRLMIFACAVILQAAVDRMGWLLPDPGFPKHWSADFYVYVLLLPLVVFDFLSIGRIHRVTLACVGALLCGHVLLNQAWGNLAWHRVAFSVVESVR